MYNSPSVVLLAPCSRLPTTVWIDYDTYIHCVLHIAPAQDRHAAGTDLGTRTGWSPDPPRCSGATLRQASCNRTDVCIAQAGGSVMCMLASHMHTIHHLLFHCATMCIIPVDTIYIHRIRRLSLAMPPMSSGQTKTGSPTTSSSMTLPRFVGLSPLHVLH